MQWQLCRKSHGRAEVGADYKLDVPKLEYTGINLKFEV